MTRIKFNNVTKSYSLLNSAGIKDFILHFFKYIKEIRKNKILVLENISFEIKDSDVVGIIGKNGAGKSTTLGLIAKVFTPTTGTVDVHGKLAPLLELGAGFHPELTGRENIILNAVLLGMTRGEILDKIDSIIEFSELGEFINQPIRIYSSGMLSRLGFSVAVHIDPDILLIDEVLSVGDFKFQEKSKKKIFEFKEQNKTIILVSHNLKVIKELCNRVILIHDHHLIFEGDVDKGIEMYEKL